MGATPEEAGWDSELPRHRVTVSAFRRLRHEVTNGELRRLFGDHRGEDEVPAGGVTWYEAYTYAAWLGGRLPTESEWEYAARAGCPHAYCTRLGRSAFDHGKPVVVLMAGGSLHPELREDDPRARAVMRDFRGELDRVAVFFGDETAEGEPGSLQGFRELVRRKLVEVRQTQALAGGEAAIDGESRRDAGAPSVGAPSVGARLRCWPQPTLPDQPYPLLLPYTHPELLGGRERELEDLRRTLSRRLPIVGLHATSGTGKSSLLAGGLVPGLRAEGHPVAFDCHPAEPGLAGRLLDDLLDGTATASLAHDAFVDRLTTSGIYFRERKQLILRFRPGEDTIDVWDRKIEGNSFLFLSRIGSRLLLGQLNVGIEELRDDDFEPLAGGDVFAPNFVTAMLPLAEGTVLVATFREGLYLLERGAATAGSEAPKTSASSWLQVAAGFTACHPSRLTATPASKRCPQPEGRQQPSHANILTGPREPKRGDGALHLHRLPRPQ